MKNLFFILLLLFLKSNLFAQKQVSAKTQLEALGRATNWQLNAMNNNDQTNHYKYLYKNESPYGKDVSLVYDKFFDSVNLSFTNEDDYRQEIKVKNLDFIDNWKFKYKGSTYRIGY